MNLASILPTPVLGDWCFDVSWFQSQHLCHFFFLVQFNNFIEFGIHYAKYVVTIHLLVISKESYNCCSGMMLSTLKSRESLGSASIIIMTEIYSHKKCLTLPLYYLRISYSSSLPITYISIMFALYFNNDF